MMMRVVSGVARNLLPAAKIKAAATLKNIGLKAARPALVLFIAILLVQATSEIHSYFYTNYDISKIRSHDLKPAPIDPTWILSGSPRFFGIVFERSPGTLSGVWECIGPGKFVWHYSVDETIYVLEGSAEIDYLGKKYVINPRDSLTFSSGTTAIWDVRDHVKKTFRIKNPGPLTKLVRAVF